MYFPVKVHNVWCNYEIIQKSLKKKKISLSKSVTIETPCQVLNELFIYA